MKNFKSKVLNILLCLSVFVSLPILGCSDNDFPNPGCFQEDNRQIVDIIKEELGTIRQNCNSGFTIEPDQKVDSRPLGLFFPCNLNSDFQVDGARVVFSGLVYESFDNEDICADFFELTEIRRNE